MGDLERFIPGFVQGAGTTILVGVLSILLLLAVGLMLAALQKVAIPGLPAASTLFIELMRGNSAIVILFWVYYAVPLLPGNFQPTGFTSSVLVLGAVGGAYAAEIFRGAAQSIPRGQYDACDSLGIGFFGRESRILLPQIMAIALPSLAGLAVEIFKWVAIVSLVGVHDLLHWTEVARQQTGRTVILYLGLIVFYFICGRLILTIFHLGGRLAVPRGLRSQQKQRAGKAADVGLPVFIR